MRKVLAIGAHPDDIELGCGATLAAHHAAGDSVTMLVLTQGQNGPGNIVMRHMEQEQASKTLGANLIWGGGLDCALVPDAALISMVEQAINATNADVIYVHAPDDTHQDHRAASAAALSAARRGQRILHYQSPSTHSFNPTFFVDVENFVEKKLAALGCHSSQVENSLMVEPDVILASARHYGAMSRVKYAEAFTPSRFVWDLTNLEDKIVMHVTDDTVGAFAKALDDLASPTAAHE